MTAIPSPPRPGVGESQASVADGEDQGGSHLFIDTCLAQLDRAIDAARELGLALADAEAVRADAADRLGFPANAYLIALVGGTGVGKSSLLNGLAGEEVSRASVRRPTTATPVAWIPGSARDDLSPVLEWLGVAPTDIRMSTGDGVLRGDLAIIDLPDLDSIEPDHRSRVDAVLPRVDAVIWVTDPEKYHDALLHDELLRRWLPRLGRQLVVVNKADRLSEVDGERLRRDLERDILRMAPAPVRGTDRPRVVLTSALAAGLSDGDRAPSQRLGLDAVRTWLDEGVQAKQVVRARLLATIRNTIGELAQIAGIDPTGAATPILGPDARRTASDGASEALLRVVDLPAVRRQAIAATRARARSRGAGPLGGLTSRLFRWSGRQARVADPGAYLARWRDRGTTGPAAGAVRAVLAEPLRTAAPGTRRLLAEASSEASLVRGLGVAVDRAIGADPGEPPTSAWWTVIGLAQTVATGALALTAIWLVLWALIRFPADSASVPLVGRLPMPFVVLVLVMAVGYLLARLLGAHAGWLGRRWAAGLANRIRDNVRTEVEATAFAPVDRLEAHRRALWSAARGGAEDCTPH